MSNSIRLGMNNNIKNDNNFEDYRMKANLYELYMLAKMASTGQGAHSIYIDITKLMELEIKDDNHNNYCTHYKASVAKIRDSRKTAEEILNSMIDAKYYMGLIKSKQQERQLHDMMSKAVWAPAAESMAIFNTYLTARRTLKIDG